MGTKINSKSIIPLKFEISVMSIPKPKTILETAKNAKLAFVGARVMGPAMAKALLDKSIVNAENITLCNLNKEITENLSKDFPNSVVTQNPSEAVDGVDVVILCVPPDRVRKRSSRHQTDFE